MMSEELRALMLLYRKSKETQQKAGQDRVELQGKLRDAVNNERKAGIMLEQLQPLIHQIEGGPAALQEADRDLAATKLKAEGRPEGKAGSKAEGPALGRPEGKAEGRPEGKALEAPPAGRPK